MFALGAYNGQGANARESNDNYHIVARATYPWKTESGQIFEAGYTSLSWSICSTHQKAIVLL